jgi:hypothetical protein
MRGPAPAPITLTWRGIAVAFVLLVAVLAFHPWGS